MSMLPTERNLTPVAHEVTADARAKIKHQNPLCLWLTGLSGAGKSTIANALDQRLYGSGFHTFVLDGDNIRNGLCRDLGFEAQDRTENIRRVAEVARLMQQAGLIVIVAFISPFRAERNFARGLFDREEFFEIFIDTPLSVCERRDPKGLYKKARSGQLKDFTGLDSPYEAPLAPEITLDASSLTLTECVEIILANCDLRRG